MYVSQLKKKSANLVAKIASQERCIRDLRSQLSALTVNDWAAALNSQQKIVSSLRRQLNRSERGWKAECAAFAAAVAGMGEYKPGANATDENNR